MDDHTELWCWKVEVYSAFVFFSPLFEQKTIESNEILLARGLVSLLLNAVLNSS